MYRPEWFPTEDNILTMALNVHGFMNGSYITSVECHELDMKCLRYVLENWKESVHSHEFDEAVKNMNKILE